MTNNSISRIAYNIGEEFASIFINHLRTTNDVPDYWDYSQVEYLMLVFNELTHQSIRVQLIPESNEDTDSIMTKCFIRVSLIKSEKQVRMLDIDQILLNSERFISDPAYATSVFSSDKLNDYIKAIWSEEQRYMLKKEVSN